MLFDTTDDLNSDRTVTVAMFIERNAGMRATQQARRTKQIPTFQSEFSIRPKYVPFPQVP
jgi:hypothetical protein